MSDTIEIVKKKKPIVPIIMVLLVVAAGGFFVIKGKVAGKTQPAIVLADKDLELEEFLTNTENPAVYVRAKIAIRLRKDYDEGKLKTNMGDLRDAVILVLNNTPPATVTDPFKRASFKKKIAAAINKALAPTDDPPVEEPKKKPKGSKKVKDPAPEEVEDRSDWDSLTGPILKVRFTSLATQ